MIHNLWLTNTVPTTIVFKQLVALFVFKVSPVFGLVLFGNPQPFHDFFAAYGTCVVFGNYLALAKPLFKFSSFGLSRVGAEAVLRCNRDDLRTFKVPDGQGVAVASLVVVQEEPTGFLSR